MSTFALIIIFLVALSPAQAQNIFDQKNVSKIKITAPFQSLFDKRLTAPSQVTASLTESIEGKLEVINNETNALETYDITIKMRGNMTLHSCQFPKLKIKFKKEQVSKNKVFSSKSYDLATHCLNKINPTNYMEINYLSASPHREKFIFDLQASLGFVSPLTANSNIDYIDNSNATQITEYLNKDAFWIESNGQMLKRYNAMYSIIGKNDFSKKQMEAVINGVHETDDLPQKLFLSVIENPEVSPQEAIKMHLLQLLIKNQDFYVKLNTADSLDYGKMGLWNVKMVALSNTKWALYSNDFNLANIISNADQAQTYSNIMDKRLEDKTISQLKHIGTIQDQKEAIQFFIDKKDELYSKAELITNDDIF